MRSSHGKWVVTVSRRHLGIVQGKYLIKHAVPTQIRVHFRFRSSELFTYCKLTFEKPAIALISIYLDRETVHQEIAQLR